MLSLVLFSYQLLDNFLIPIKHIYIYIYKLQGWILFFLNHFPTPTSYVFFFLFFYLVMNRALFNFQS